MSSNTTTDITSTMSSSSVVPVISWYPRHNLTRLDLQTLLRLHRHHAASSHPSQEPGHQAEAGTVLLVICGLLVILFLFVVIKCKPEEKLKSLCDREGAAGSRDPSLDSVTILTSSSLSIQDRHKAQDSPPPYEPPPPYSIAILMT